MSRDIPILFSTAMVLALLTGRKTQTRRLAWKSPTGVYPDVMDPHGDEAARTLRKRGWKVSGCDDTGSRIGWPPTPWQKVKAGDRLWVREDWRVNKNHDAKSPKDLPVRRCTIIFTAGGVIDYTDRGWLPDNDVPWERGSFPDWAGRRRASMHLPMWGSRITLPVVGNKVERLQSISHEDAMAEGVEVTGPSTFGVRGPGGGWLGTTFATAPEAYSYLWRALHGAESWDSNPEVAAMSFNVVHANIGAVAKEAA